MKKYTVGFLLLFGISFASTALATSSTCYEYYLGDTPYIAHKSTYSASDAALAPTFGMKTLVTSPALPEINNYWSANSGGGSQTIADTPYFAGYWSWAGAGATGVLEYPTFYFVESTLSTCSEDQTYGPPTGTYVDINPNTAWEGQTVYFSWGHLA